MQKKKKKDVQQQRLVVSADARPADQHPRRYNRAEGFQEVAVPMDEEQVHQDIVLRRRADAEGPALQKVNETHRAFEALHFVLLLSWCTDGWQPSMRQAVANGRGDMRGLTPLQYYAHRLQQPPGIDDSLFPAVRLLQEFVRGWRRSVFYTWRGIMLQSALSCTNGCSTLCPGTPRWSWPAVSASVGTSSCRPPTLADHATISDGEGRHFFYVKRWTLLL